MPGKTLLIRADASAEMGAGHVMRCIALAQAWQKTDGRAVFALAAGQELEGRIRSEGAGVERIHATPGSRADADQIAELCGQLRAEWVVIDGYHFSAEYRGTMRAVPARLLMFDDDSGCAPGACDIALNPDPDADLAIPEADATVYLRGPRYALLRREFLRFRRESDGSSDPTFPDTAFPETACRILVTLGGGDSHNVTRQVFDALEKSRDLDLDVTVIVGANYPHTESLQAAMDASQLTAKLLRNVDHIPELMAHADLAITAGGGTCYELAFMHVPMFLVTMAKNHERAVEAYASAGAAFDAGWFSSLNQSSLAASLRKVICDRELRTRLATNAARTVDGRGADRVVDAMCGISQGARKVQV